MQISGKTHPHIADNLPMPKACKEVFHPGALETMRIIIFLLVVTQFLTTNKWQGNMDAALVGAIIHGGPQQRGRNQKWLPHPYPLGGHKKIWHIPNAQEALKTPLWNNKLVERGQN